MSCRAGRRFAGGQLAVGLLIPFVCAAMIVATGADSREQGMAADEFAVAVDFAAVDDRGGPVTDLRPDEVVLRVGRATADIRTLRFLRVASHRTGTNSRAAALRFGSAEATDFERTFLIVIDEESLPSGTEQSTREALRALVRGLDPQDRVGLVMVPHAGVRAPLTIDHGRVLQAVQQISGRAQGRESATDAACRTRNVLRELDSLLGTVEHPGGPLVVLFVSASMYDGGGAVQAPFGTAIACDLQLSDFRQLGGRAAQSRSYLYIVQPETFAEVSWTSNPRSGLEHLAGATGGRILQLNGRDSGVLDRVRLEMSGVYLAVARVQGQARPGTALAISLKVSRPGVTVITRPQVAIPPGSSRSR